jgi:putative membrane protein
METTLGNVLGALQSGLPVLLLQFAVTLALLALGIACYVAVTPFHEWRLAREGNVAAAVALAGTVVALAIPLAATLAASLVTLDIVIWGLVALALQLLTFGAATLLMRGLRARIEAGDVAAAIVLVGVQVAVALLNAGAMSG